MKINSILLMCILPAILCTHAPARIIYVDNNSPADFNNIQAAIDDANNGDTVIVANGTYTGDGNHDIDFMGKVITVKSENGPDNCIIDCHGMENDPHRGFYFHNNEDANSLVHGFTITNGYAIYGGGIACDEASPVIKNCIIKSNTGGGVHCIDSDVIIVGCTICKNKAGFGGGISLRNTHVQDGGTIQDCIINENIATSGGGISCLRINPLICNCIISHNISNREFEGIISNRDGGGGMNFSKSNPRLINCTIVNNKANLSGGGIICPSGWGEIIIENCIIWGNIAKYGNQLARTCCLCVVGCQMIKLQYCCIQMDDNAIFAEYNSDSWETGNQWTINLDSSHSIDADPCFLDPGYWDPNGTLEDANDDFWVEGDYHLKSQAGRWDTNSQSWVQDDVTSPCIDAGDPNSPIGLEPFPNGGYVNMGAYGGTSQASKSYFGKPVCQTIVAGDINGDCKVDELDLYILMLHWLENNNP